MKSIEEFYEEGEEFRQAGLKKGYYRGASYGYLGGLLFGGMFWYGELIEDGVNQARDTMVKMLLSFAIGFLFFGLLTVLYKLKENTTTLQREQGLYRLKDSGLQQAFFGWVALSASTGFIYTAILFNAGVDEMPFFKWVAHLPYVLFLVIRSLLIDKSLEAKSEK